MLWLRDRVGFLQWRMLLVVQLTSRRRNLLKLSEMLRQYIRWNMNDHFGMNSNDKMMIAMIFCGRIGGVETEKMGVLLVMLELFQSDMVDCFIDTYIII